MQVEGKTAKEQLDMRLDFINATVYRSDIGTDAAKKIAAQVKEIKKLMNSTELKNEIYREVQLDYTISDARTHADDLGYVIDDEQAKELAELFLYKYQDCNLDENSNWEQLIKDYAKDNNLDSFMVETERD